MVKGVILVDLTDQGRRAIKDSPDRAEASKAEATKLASRSKTFSIRQVDRMMLQLSSRRRALSLSTSSWREGVTASFSAGIKEQKLETKTF